MTDKNKNRLIGVFAVLFLCAGFGFIEWLNRHVEQADILVVDTNHTPVSFVDVRFSHTSQSFSVSQGTDMYGRVMFGGSHMPRGLYAIEIRTTGMGDATDRMLYFGNISLDKTKQNITIRLKNVLVKTITQFVPPGTDLPSAKSMDELFVIEPYASQ